MLSMISRIDVSRWGSLHCHLSAFREPSGASNIVFFRQKLVHVDNMCMIVVCKLCMSLIVVLRNDLALRWVMMS